MTQQNTVFSKSLPTNYKAEETAIGGILLDNKLVEDVRHFLKPEDFHHPFVKSAMEAVFELASEQKAIDPITICNKMKEQGKSVLPDDILRITNFSTGLPYFKDLLDYIAIVKDKSLLRQLIKLCSQIIEMALSEEYKAADLLDYAEKQIFDLRDKSETKKEEYALVYDINVERNAELEENKKLNKPLGLKTGLDACDQMTSGMQDEDLTITAGRPSSGKSALLLDEINGIHKFQKDVVSIMFSCEMSKKLCGDRLLCQRAQVSLQGYRNNMLSFTDRSNIADATEEGRGMKIIIIDESRITPMRMRYHINRVADKFGRIDYIAADYVGLMRDDKEWKETREMVGAIAEGCKQIAKDYKVPFNLASQLNRDCEKRTIPRPMVSDLSESDKLGAHSDVVRFVYREAMYKPTEENKHSAEIIYGKNRNGPTRIVKVFFNGVFTHFSNLQLD